MKTCPACNEKIKDDALRCKHCGIDLDVRKCPWCAEIIEKDAQKCKHCKSYIEKVRCGSCGKHTEVKEMRCPECIERFIAEELAERTRNIKKNYLFATIILVGLILFALSKIL